MILFRPKNCKKKLQRSDVSGSVGNTLKVEKPVADLHSTSYRLYSTRTGADTALIIQTSVRQQKETEAMFFFFFFWQSMCCLPSTEQLNISVRPSPL